MTHASRIYPLNSLSQQPGCVLYWMQRDQRVNDNWALLYAQETALKTNLHLKVVFCLAPGYPGATMRQYGFMLKGLQEVEKGLNRLNIPFDLITGDPGEMLPGYIRSVGAGVLVTDFNPLRINMQWKERVGASITIPFYEVDAHNILPCRAISDKLEYAAFTLRKKLEKHLSEYLVEFPSLVIQPSSGIPLQPVDWRSITASLKANGDVAEVDWIVPGEAAAQDALDKFIRNRLDTYASERNFPERQGQSDLSPWLHFGHLSAQRFALAVQKSATDPESKQAFLEELIVRRELADNFCLHNPHYDTTGGFQSWARKSLDLHRDDPREYCYTIDQFEQSRTHDSLWNAAQREMVATGKMHGYMRMYWAKKILEWTPSPEEAMAVAIYLNDKYELDGRDPNGYAGIAWSIGGTHDRPWGERKIFGMIRYMNARGCERKFDTKRYIALKNKI